MEDSELAAIRAARLAELQKNAGQGGSSGAPDKKDEMRSTMLAQILEHEARERLSRVRIVRPDRAQAVEEYLVRLASSGQLRRKIGEEELVEILDGLARDQKKQTDTKIVFNRRQLAGDSEDEDDFFD